MATRKCGNIYFLKYFMAVRKFTNISISKYFCTSVKGVLPLEVAQAVEVPTTLEATELGRGM